MQILQWFGNASGLHTNFNKSSVLPIPCANIDLDDVLQALPAQRQTVPARYLGRHRHSVIVIHDGQSMSFWFDRWLRKSAPKMIAPNLFPISRRKNRTVVDAMHDDYWIRDIKDDMLHEFVHLWTLICATQLSSGISDAISWRFTPDGCNATPPSRHTNCNAWARIIPIWRSWAPSKCKLFAWLAIQR